MDSFGFSEAEIALILQNVSRPRLAQALGDLNHKVAGKTSKELEARKFFINNLPESGIKPLKQPKAKTVLVTWNTTVNDEGFLINRYSGEKIEL